MPLPILERSVPAGRAAVSHVTVAAHIFALATIVMMLVWLLHFRGGLAIQAAVNKDLIINAHPVIMFMGFILVSGEAIMAYNTISTIRKTKKAAHMLLNLFAISMGVWGVLTAFKFHRESEVPSMYTLHSWLGVITMCLYGSQWLFGFLFFWCPGAALPVRAMLIPWHALAGITSFLMAICAAETGLMQKAVGPGVESKLVNCTALCILLFGFTVCVSTIIPRL